MDIIDITFNYEIMDIGFIRSIAVSKAIVDMKEMSDMVLEAIVDKTGSIDMKSPKILQCKHNESQSGI
jgi:hypothetical protein